ncbi:MAG TPA: NAD(P)H-hydrate dehydratase, partial [Petrotogaceae bacterium]|nr:NAD(P)H-hydrate dehydratase [Petrotogaceae bacterium]
GSSALSKGGSGDLLAGITAGFAAQGLDLLQSAVLASYVTYKTAALLAQEMTEYSVSPLLIANNIYKALKELSDK